MSNTPYVAVHRLNGGKTPPGGFITFENEDDSQPLLESGAIREATDVELTVYEQTQVSEEAKSKKPVKAATKATKATSATAPVDPAAKDTSATAPVDPAAKDTSGDKSLV